MKKLIVLATILTFILIAKISISAQEVATEEPDVIREKVQEKVTGVQNKPKAYLGTVTDIAENTVQIKNLEGEIQQVLVGDETSFININSTTKTVNYSDVAIGDFLVNMGYLNSNEVLETKRVLITAEPAQLPYTSRVGVVTNHAGDELEIRLLGSQDSMLVSPDTNILVTQQEQEEQTKTSFSKIVEGSTIIVVGVTNGDNLKARSIHIIKQGPSEE